MAMPTSWSQHCSCTHARPAMAGVTLIELVVTITIAGILLAIAQPTYQSVTNSSRIAGEVNGLLGDLQLARSEAVKQGRTITVCASTDAVNCSNSSNWQSGWIVFLDTNNNGTIDNGETALRVQRRFSGTDTFQATNNIVAVNFNREGLAAGIANGTLFKLHDASGNSNWTRCLSLGMVGQLTTQKYGEVLNGVTCT